MRERGIPEVMVRARVRVELELSEEFEVKIGVHQ